MRIIAFTGKRGHGKSTAAEAAVRQYGYVHLNFADPLREVCHVAYGVTYEEMSDPVLKEKVLERWPFKSPRELLQQIGTEMFRAYLDDTWVTNWMNRASQALADAPGVVCSDCRFLNEAAAIRSVGGKIIKVERPSLVRADLAAQHQSEVEIDKIAVDRVLINDRSMADLEAAALAAIIG